MVNSKKSNFRKNRNPKGFNPNGARAKKINASTAFDTYGRGCYSHGANHCQ